MNTDVLKTAGMMIGCVVLFSQVVLVGRSRTDLPLRYQRWLEEDVAYLVTPREKKVFLELKNDRERDIFVEAFWKQRDPIPGTAENEFQEEHYRRIGYANSVYGRGTSKPGWKTDRGRIYIILGRPISVKSYGEESYNLVPIEVWTYQGDFRNGLPSSFYVVFFREEGVGDYILYSPFRHGPRKLLEAYDGDPHRAIDILAKVDGELASVSRSLVPGQGAFYDTRPSLASETLLNKIETLPQRQIDDVYAEKLLKYASFVEVDHSVDYVSCDFLIKVLRAADGRHFVHYLLEPNRISINLINGKYSLQLEAYGMITDLQGKTVYQFQKKPAIDFRGEEVEEIKAKKFCFAGAFPIIPGRYKFDLLLKNGISKEFSSADEMLVVPDEPMESGISSLILSSGEARAADGSSFQPFLFGGLRLFPRVNKTYGVQDSLVVSCALGGISDAVQKTGFLDFTFYKENEKVYSRRRAVRDLRDPGLCSEEFDLRDMAPGYYTLGVRLLDKEGTPVSSSQETFIITPAAHIPSSWILAEGLPALDDPSYGYILGTQFLSTDQVEKALPLLEEASSQDPHSLEYALGLAQAHFRIGDYSAVQKGLSIFLQKSNEQMEIYSLLADSCFKLERYGQATYYYKKYLAHFGTNLQILNNLAESYFRLGDFGQALSIWKRSLELDSNQEEIQRRVSLLEKGHKETVPLEKESRAQSSAQPSQ
jgi:GWxTD domain-containing protein